MAKYLTREIGLQINKALQSIPVIVVTGMRQVGKTTFITKDPIFKNRLFSNLDDIVELNIARNNPLALFEPDRPITIDEVQRAPELMQVIKTLVDRNRKAGMFLLSGSANLLLMSHVSESLAGRALYLEMSPMTRRELSGDLSHEPFICRTLVSGTIKRSGRFPSIRSVDIITGGMPPVAAIHENSSFWFKGFEQTYLERDMRSLAQVADLVEFQLFLRIIALRIGSILNTSELGRDAKISSHTSARYLRLLETSYTIFKIRPFLQSKVSRLVKSSKVYISDSGLAAHLRGTTSGVTDKNHDGSLLENYVAQNLRAVLAARCPEANLYYWNVQGRFEVDFIIEYGDRTVAIEIKWGTRWTANDLVGLRHFMEKTSSCILGILACNVPEVVPLSDRLFAVPIALLLS